MEQGQAGPYLVSGGVQDTLHCSSPSVTQACTIQIARPSCLLKEIVGAIACILRSQLHHAAFYASMFLVPKPNGTFRQILNVSKLNVHILCLHFKMETGQSVCAAVRTQDWTCTRPKLERTAAVCHLMVKTASPCPCWAENPWI